MSEILSWILAGGIPISTIITWFLARRKNNAEASLTEAEASKSEAAAKISELDVVEKAVTIWREMSERLEESLKEQSKKIESLEHENKQLRLEIQKLRNTNSKIVKALDKINSENIEIIVRELKDKLNE